MRKFFKRAEKQPFTYPSIEERRTSHNYLGWIMGILILIAGAIILIRLF